MKITYLRKKRNMTQSELAAKAGATQQQIALIEAGRSDPRLSTLQNIAGALDCEIGNLFFSLTEFRDTLNEIIRVDFKEKPESLMKLNSYCAARHFISPFDPHWEKVALVKGSKITIKKGEHHENR